MTGHTAVPAPDRRALASFWAFALERQAVWQRRARGLPPPWTDDPVLRAHRFTNIYRELDRGTIAAHRYYAAEARRGSPRDLAWRAVCFRLFNRAATLQEVDFPSCAAWPRMRRGALDALRARSAAGRPLYTGAHQVRACTVDWAGELLDSAHAFLQGWDFRERGAAAFYAGLKEVRFMGEFLGHQVCRDLAEEGALSGGRDWCVVGPGARAGLRLLYGAGLPRAAEPAAIAALLETQSVRALVAAGGRRMRAPEAEHALCEFFKYDRIRSSAGFARTKGGPFRPSEEPL